MLALGRETPAIIGGGMDVLYVGVTLGFLALSWGLIALCERL
jgi:hypothetical protein